MYIRAQFTGQAFKDLLRFRTSSMTRPCPQMYFEGPRLLLTRVEFIEVTELFEGPKRDLIYPNNRPQEHVFQKSRLGLKLKFRVSGATLNANNDPEPIASQEGFVKVVLDVLVQNGKDFLSVEMLETDFDSLLNLAGAGKQEMSNLLGAGQVELGLLGQINDLAKDIGGFLTVRHADLGFDVGADRVELRVEFESSLQALPIVLSEWTQFYSNSLESITGAGAWAFQLDRRIGTELLSRVMTAAIDGTGQFSRDGDVSVSWDAGLPGYRAGVEGEVIDACWCAWGEIDLDVRLWAEVRFSLQNSRLRIDVRFDHKVTDVAEAACCVLTTVALFPIVGLGLALKGEIAWYEYLAGLALYPSPVLLLVAVIARLSSKLAEGPPVEICQKDPDDDKHFFCEFDLPELSEATSCQGAKLKVRADSLIGRGDGLVLGGRIETPAIVDPAIGLDVTGFKYTPARYNCNGSADHPEQYVASIRVFRTSGNYDFRVCQVHVLGPFKYAANVVVEEMTCPYTAWVTITIGVTQYDNKPVKVIVSTTHGAIHSVIPAGPPVSEEQRKQMDLAAHLERVSRCYAKSRKWDIRWLVDPAPYINVVKTRQIWTVVGIAAAQASRVDVVNEAGAPLAVVDTGAGRAFRVSLIEVSGALSVVQDVTGDSERLEDAELHVVQTLAGVERELGFETPVVAVDAVRMSPVQTVIVHERDRLTLFDVNERGELLRMGTVETSEMQWVGRRGATLYAALRDGGMLQLDLEDGPAAGWRQESAVKKKRQTRGCGCGGAMEDAAVVKHPAVSLPLDARQFDHIVYKGDINGGYSETGVRIRNGYWIEEVEGVLVTYALDRKLQSSGEVRIDNPAAAMVVRLRTRALLTRGDGRNKLELLRVLDRQEL